MSFRTHKWDPAILTIIIQCVSHCITTAEKSFVNPIRTSSVGSLNENIKFKVFKRNQKSTVVQKLTIKLITQKWLEKWFVKKKYTNKTTLWITCTDIWRWWRKNDHFCSPDVLLRCRLFFTTAVTPCHPTCVRRGYLACDYIIKMDPHQVWITWPKTGVCDVVVYCNYNSNNNRREGFFLKSLIDLFNI